MYREYTLLHRRFFDFFFVCVCAAAVVARFPHVVNERNRIEDEQAHTSHFASGEYKQFMQHYWQISERVDFHVHITGKHKQMKLWPHGGGGERRITKDFAATEHCKLYASEEKVKLCRNNDRIFIFFQQYLTKWFNCLLGSMDRNKIEKKLNSK